MKHLAAMLSGLLLAFAAALPGAAEARSELSASFAANLQADAGCNDALVTESVRATEIDREDNRSGPAPDTAFPHIITDVPALAGSCSGVATPAPIQGGIASAPYQARAPPRM